MQIDEKALEAIVREIVERLLSTQPELFARPRADAAETEQVLEHHGRLLSEDVLLVCRKQGKRAVRVDPKTILTPLARDRAHDLGIRVLVREPGQ